MEKKTLGQKLVLYGIGAGAASMAVPADADIIWSGPVEFSGNSIYYDLENVVPPSSTPDAANHDFRLSFSKKKAKHYDAPANSMTTGATDFVTRGMYPRSYAVRHGFGDTIGGGGNFGNFTYLQNYYGTGGYVPPGSGLGDWHPGDRGFLGLRLTVGGNVFYGWADVTLNNMDGTGVGAFTLHSYAYENVADTPILTGAVPEPSAIALLVAGAAGVLALKRRQK